MNATLLEALIAAAAVIAVPLGAWLVARRRTSGSIETSDAATLWAEGNAMRQEAIEELRLCRSASIALRAELTAVRVEMADLRRELRASGGGDD